MIDRQYINDEILRQPIHEIIGDFVPLTRQGANYKGCCPFHNERTPSFIVSPTKGIYRCFGCGVSGNVLTFLQSVGHTFPEAVMYIVKKYNLPPPPSDSGRTAEAASVTEAIYIALSFAAQYFSDQLPLSTQAMQYLVQRGISPDIIAKFEIGYHPAAPADILTHACTKGYTPDILEKSGLIKSHPSRSYPFAADRIQFPIHSPTGRVIGFGARVLGAPSSNIPKYINTPDTHVYQKSKSLYGIAQARQKIIQRKMCYLVEGYIDVLSMHVSGNENVVATCGTALTSDQASLIKRYTPAVTVIFDDDPAGISGTVRAIGILLSEGLMVNIVQLPASHDPSSYLDSVGAQLFNEYLATHTVDFFKWYCQIVNQHRDDPQRQSVVLAQLREAITKIPDRLTRQTYINYCVTHLDIPKKAIQESSDPRRVVIPTKPPPPSGKHQIESWLLRLLIEHGGEPYTDVFPIAIEVMYAFRGYAFSSDSHRLIFEAYRAYAITYNEFPPISHFTNHPTSDIQAASISVLLPSHELSLCPSPKDTTYLLSQLNNLKTTESLALNAHEITTHPDNPELWQARQDIFKSSYKY